MKKNTKFPIFFVMVFVLVIPFSAADAQKVTEEATWYPFALGERMATHSPANVGALILDAPAGKHGFLRRSGDGFAFQDGTRGRFWGTNLVFNACFPSETEARQMARRLAFFGFNAVRLHHMDASFEPRGIFQDTPDAPSPQMKPTGSLSPEQLERLDYLIYQLKAHGIYVNVNLLVSRRFTEADGVSDALDLPKAAKPVSLLDPHLIELQKRYAQDLLSHENPHTGLSYREDPAVAFVEITNENSLVSYWKWDRLNGPMLRHGKSSLPERYAMQLDRQWNEWLKKRYDRPEYARGTWASGRVKRAVPQKTATPSPPSAGDARDTIRSRTIFIPDDPPSQFRFKRPRFPLKGSVTSKKSRDIRDFYMSLEKRYFDDMTHFLKNELGVKIPITGIGGYSHRENLKTMSAADYFDRHTYWDHPRFPGEAWDKDDFRIRNHSIFEDADLGFIGNAVRNTPGTGRPLTLSEWNHCFPNVYAYETPAVIATEARKSGWDALFQFAYSHGWQDRPEYNRIQHYFDTLANAQHLILTAVGSLLFLEDRDASAHFADGVYFLNAKRVRGVVGALGGKTLEVGRLKIRSDQDGAALLYASDGKPLERSDRIILVTLGGIKNTRSRWEDSRFDWGEAPTLLKQMNVEMTLRSESPYQIHKLDEEGQPSDGVASDYDTSSKNLTFSTRDSKTPWFVLER